MVSEKLKSEIWYPVEDVDNAEDIPLDPNRFYFFKGQVDGLKEDFPDLLSSNATKIFRVTKELKDTSNPEKGYDNPYEVATVDFNALFDTDIPFSPDNVAALVQEVHEQVSTEIIKTRAAILLNKMGANFTDKQINRNLDLLHTNIDNAEKLLEEMGTSADEFSNAHTGNKPLKELITKLKSEISEAHEIFDKPLSENPADHGFDKTKIGFAKGYRPPEPQTT